MFYNFTVFKNWKEEFDLLYTHRKGETQPRREMTCSGISAGAADRCAAAPRREADPRKHVGPVRREKFARTFRWNVCFFVSHRASNQF